MARSLMALLLVVLGMPALASAERGFRHGRIRQADYGATIQRGTETSAEEAVPNLPYLPGDRVWTDGNARVEFQFTGGSTLRLDRGSKLDYVAHDDSRHERFVLRLWSGGLYLHGDKRDGLFEVETPGGVVSSDGRSVLRVDFDGSETRLSVYEGEARLDDQKVEAGERVYARDGRVDEPRGFDRAESDDFALWDEDQERQMAYASNERRLPEELSIYESELEGQGVWYHEASIGQTVWRPRVGIGWRPYMDGRWAWTPYGWTWIAGERWGWATSHYGRWGYSPAGSWYWIPSVGWGPAWVSWAVGGDYIGWCPLGYGNRPVIINHVTVINNHRGRRGHGSRDTWTYARRGDLTSRDLARRRVERIDPTVARELRVIDNPHQRLARDFTIAAPKPAVQVQGGPTEGDARAMPRQRAVRTKPTIGDTVPELRADPMTTIPFPIARRKPRTEETEQKDGEGTPENSAVRSFPRRHSAGQSAETATPESQPTDARTPVTRRGFDASVGERTRRHGSEDEASEAAPRRVPDAGRDRDRSRDENAERDVLRPIFRPLSRPRSDDGASTSAPRSTPRGERAEPRSEPRTEPRSQPRYEPRSAPRQERPRVEPQAPPQSQPPADASSGHGRARRRDQ